MSTFTQDWRCVTHTKLVSLRNKLRSIRLVWVTAVALQLLLNDKYKLESLQEDGSRTRQEIPQTAGCQATACNCCFRWGEANPSRWCFPLKLTSIKKLWETGEWLTNCCLKLLAWKNCWMISTSLNHCKKMGAEPGRRFLRQPAAKLEPVIVVHFLCCFLTRRKSASSEPLIGLLA